MALRALRSLARVSRLSSRVLLSSAPRALALRSPATTAIAGVCGIALSARFLSTSAAANGADKDGVGNHLSPLRKAIAVIVC